MTLAMPAPMSWPASSAVCVMPDFREKIPRIVRQAAPPAVVGLLLLLACAAIYSPVLGTEYLLADDYPQFCDRQDWKTHAPYGRPLLGVLFRLVPERSEDLAPFTRLRALSLLATAAFGTLLWSGALRRMLPAETALVAAIGCLALPPFHFCIAASTAYPITIAAAVSLGAGVLTVNRFCFAPSCGVFSLAATTIAAAMLEIGALTVYQPAAMCYWAALVPAVLDPRFRIDERFRRRVGIAFGIGLGATAVYFAAFQGAAWFGLIEAPPRVGLTTDLLGKLAWFIEKPLIRAAALWGVYEWRHLAAGAAIAIAATAWRTTTFRLPAEDRKANRLRTLAFTLLPLLAYAPVLAVAENWASYRSMIALSVTAYLIVVAAAYRLYRFIPVGKRTAFAGSCFAAICIGSYAAHRNVADNIVAVQRAELNYLLATLQSQLTPVAAVRSIHVIMSPYDRGPGFRCRGDEFGVRSASRPRWTVDMVRCAERLLGRDEANVTYSAPGEKPPRRDDVLVVDMNQIAWKR